jgi:hypothetical protein
MRYFGKKQQIFKVSILVEFREASLKSVDYMELPQHRCGVD